MQEERIFLWEILKQLDDACCSCCDGESNVRALTNEIRARFDLCSPELEDEREREREREDGRA